MTIGKLVLQIPKAIVRNNCTTASATSSNSTKAAAAVATFTSRYIPIPQQQQQQQQYYSTVIEVTSQKQNNNNTQHKNAFNFQQPSKLNNNNNKNTTNQYFSSMITQHRHDDEQEEEEEEITTQTTTKSKNSSTSRKLKKDAITVTPSAAKRISYLLSTATPETINGQYYSKPLGIRLGVKRRGCNGLSYTLNYAYESPKKSEEVLECHGIMVIIEPMALFSVVGTVMDWVESDLTSEFTFENPNSKGECGCGESFTV